MKSPFLPWAAFFAAVLFIATPAGAQRKYTIEPSKLAIGQWDPSVMEQLDIKIHIYNTTEETLSIQWRLGKDNLLKEWKPQICDNMNCFEYDQLVGETKTMTVGKKSEPAWKQGEFKLSVYPLDFSTNVTTYGTGTLSVILADVNNLSEMDTLLFTAKVVATSVEFGESSGITVSPNPAGDYIAVTALSTTGSIAVISALGSVEFETSLENGASYINLGGLTQGVYFLRITDAAGKTSAQKFVKR